MEVTSDITGVQTCASVTAALKQIQAQREFRYKWTVGCYFERHFCYELTQSSGEHV